jgi:hypothetical protein
LRSLFLGLDLLLHVKHRSGSFFFLKKANPIFFCFFMFVNLRDGEKNPKKQIPKKEDKKKAKTSGQTDGRTNGQTDGQMDGQTDERTQRGVAESASQIIGSEHVEAGRGRFCR